MSFCYIRLKDDPNARGHCWKVRAARSVEDAYYEIAQARVSGSIGSSRYEQRWNNGKFSEPVVIADVIEVNSDYTERQPYTPVY